MALPRREPPPHRALGLVLGRRTLPRGEHAVRRARSDRDVPRLAARPAPGVRALAARAADVVCAGARRIDRDPGQHFRAGRELSLPLPRRPSLVGAGRGGVHETSMNASAPALRCENLIKKYGELAAVDGLDLEVRRGECFGLLGPNGAGKTTTVEILEGLNDPTSGSVEVLGMRWETDENPLRQRLGISLQETHLPDRLTVEENLRLFRSFYAR